MAHDVFVSHSSYDKTVADMVCARLEARGIRCWMATRDALAGRPYGQAIVDAIGAAKVMVLVFSKHANSSHHIQREVERGVSKGLIIVPFRIENVAPEGALDYSISSVHWLDALTPPVESHLEKLSDTIARLLPAAAPPASPVFSRSSAQSFTAPVPVPGDNRWQKLKSPQVKSSDYVHLGGAAWDADRSKLYALIGYNSQQPACEMLVYSGATNSWESRPTPDDFLPRFWSSGAWHPGRRRLYVFGGSSRGVPRQELWVYVPDDDAWTRLNPDGEIPIARASSALAIDQASERLVMFGGQPAFGPALNDLWTYSIADNAWEELTPDGTPPPGLVQNATAWDETERAFYVCGQFSTGTLVSLWVYHAVDNRWTWLREAPGPSPRSDCAACRDSGARRMYVFGGAGGNTGFNDVWLYDADAHSWTELSPTNTPPGPRWGHAGLWDDTTRRMYVFGGNGPSGALTQLWAYTPE
jgi:TIR domain/Galactose oxidase, central domain